MTKEFLEKLRKLEKSYFTLADLEKIWSGKRESLKVILSRLTKRGELKRIQKNVYFLPGAEIEIEKIANEIYFPSYLSFESALSKWGILSQIPYSLTFATTLKTKRVEIENITIEYRKIKEELFFGYTLLKGVWVAKPEKALCDTFYLVSLGKLKFNFENLDLRKIQKNNFFKLIKKYPLKTQKLAKEFL